MRLVARVLIVLLLTAGAVSGQEELTTRVFTLEHRDVVDAVRMIQHVLSEDGSLRMRPTEQKLTVQDIPQVIDQVARILESFDVPPDACSGLRLFLIDAFNNAPEEAGPSEVLEEDLVHKLRRTFHLEHYRMIAASTVESLVDENVTISLGEKYVLDFRCGLSGLQRQPLRMSDVRRRKATVPLPAADKGKTIPRSQASLKTMPHPVFPQRLSLRGLTLLRRQVSGDGSVSFQEVLRTNLTLTPGQRVVLGAMASEGADRALVLVIEMPVLDDGEA